MKIGDKIKCVQWDLGLTVGQEYQIIYYYPIHCGEIRPVIKVAKDGPLYYADYFTLTKTTKNKENNMKIGQKIKCINSQDSESLFHGYTYAVTDVNQYANIQVKLDGSEHPLQHYYKPNRFEVVTDSVATIDITKEYKTKDGCKVKLFVISDCGNFPIVGQLYSDGDFSIEQWTSDGSYRQGVMTHDWDLVELKEESFSMNGLHVTLMLDGSIILGGTVVEKDEISEIIKKYEEFNS